MHSIASRIGSFLTVVSSKSDIQGTSSGAHPAQTRNPAHAGGMPPAQRHAVPEVGRPPIQGSSSKMLGMSDAKGRLVVVSNRLINPKQPAAGGLAVALGEMMYNTNGLWFGWSGKTTEEPGPNSVRTESLGLTTLAQVDLSKQHHDNYYAGFSNSVLWPVFHQAAKNADWNPAYFKGYKQVNKILAAQLAPMLKDDDVLWIHDYHLIPFAQELRALGCKQRMGFFNHIPMPPPDDIKKIPQHKELMEALFSYDLVGMQSVRDVKNFRQYVEMEGGGQRHEGALVEAFGKKTSVQDFPIGIDVERLKALAPSSDPTSIAVLNEVRSESGKGRTLMVGVDRLDYSKGILIRLEAFREYLASHREMRGKITFVQIAAPTRKIVPAYVALGEQVRELVDGINKDFETATWKPVIYFNKSVNRYALPEIYRRSRVGVVTPKIDGMNLVAKEYIAAQAPENPGVLVLSTGAGAAPQLGESLLVEPENCKALVKAYETALAMPLDERQKRHAALMNNVITQDLRWWHEGFRKTLSSVPISSAPSTQRAVTENASTASRDRDDSASSQAISLDRRESKAHRMMGKLAALISQCWKAPRRSTKKTGSTMALATRASAQYR